MVGNHVTEKVIAEVLGKTKWDTSQAVDYWFENGYADKYMPKGGSIILNEKSIAELFNKYSSDGGKTMDSDAIMGFYNDLKVDLEDPVTLLISYKMGAEKQGEYTFQMFKKGCMEYGCDTFNKWYKIIPDLKKALNQDKELFKSVYDFTF